ncbi:right-handed parallel beta-helix repeat-containing protein [Spirosoma radiotolerans]|uniref:right-handed parallel beta-helix repeat-containing protein n=1 Tax=Spirosoma radiotolerans TaxID=1379870 RepID=UPI000697D8C9|nr:right-handed parallel beta-helix repeat-containing protein [Spirosoma radiotolerans]
MLTFLLGVTVSASLAQTTYYVASNGSDNNTGRSITSPFQTLNKINSLPLKPGDQLLFRRGDTFLGTLTIRQSGSSSLPITVDAYGSGPKPVLTGSVPLSGWTDVGGGIYKAFCSACGSAVTGLYQNGIPLPLGRYPDIDSPNKGYLTIRAHTEKYQIFSQEHLPDTIDWKGGEVVMRSRQWILDRALIDHQNGDALNLIYNSNYPPADGSGYFIQNHPATLNRPGEWAYTPSMKTIYLFSNQINPNTQTINAAVQNRNIDLANCSNIALRHLHITQSGKQAIYTTNVSNFTLTDSDITNAGEDGLILTGSGSNILIENNTIVDINNNGVWLDALQNVTIRNNRLQRIGIIPGRGKGGDGNYNALQSNANLDVLIENNRIDSVGYSGISFWNNTTIQRNIIANYCMTKSDGGGIYVFNENEKKPMTNIHIVSNMIYNGIGAQEGNVREDYLGANGIFLDGCVENVELRNNTVFNNLQWGIFLHNSSKITCIDNTVFNNGNCQLVIWNNTCPVRNDVIKRNIFFSKLASQSVGQFLSTIDDINQFGQIDSNYYARPFDQEAIILGIINSTQGAKYSLDGWKHFSRGLDLHSLGSPLTFKPYKNEGAGGTNRINSTFDSIIDDWFLIYSRYGNAEVSQDMTGNLDGGSLKVSFPTPSGQGNSYAQIVKQVALTKGKTYVLRFDAVATVDVTILVYLRQYGAPFKEYDRRYSVALSPSRKSYELPFTVSDSDSNAVVLFQIDGEGPPFWLDNVRLQEDVPIQNNPDDFIKLIYNPTLKDSLVTLAGLYSDVKGQRYRNYVILKPFTSIILLKDTLPQLPADLSLSLTSNKRVLGINDLASIQLRVNNQSDRSAALSRWTCRLPANIQFVDSLGHPYRDNVLTGTVSQLAPLSDTTFTFLVQPTSAGLFRLSAQVTTATSPDPDSRPNSGTADGEDDARTIDLRVDAPLTGDRVFESPNPNQRSLPGVATNPDPALMNVKQADLSLQIEVSSRTPIVGTVITYTLSIANAGGRTAEGIQVENLLPDGFEPVSLGEWTANGHSLVTTVESIPAASIYRTSFQVRVTLPGFWLNRAQINASIISDPDSTPGNGFSNGEDDEAQVDGRAL